ncbi:hypothetical protein BA190_08765 [Labrys sp. WJW]|uniref:hypothetical protein n=1 Tax=Labrys sp. WJW TaxID=1737983 RepID=UPI000834DAF7|nr:hypothetical protein [Labrys sp. WJW]OCC05553.1 hypothetical protein BA190_08765 [Labrys sp. WJW]
MMHKMVLAISLAATLASCATITPAERRAADEQSCRGYGFKKGTDGFANCLLRLDLGRKANRAAIEQSWFYDDPFFYGSPVIRYRPIYMFRR